MGHLELLVVENFKSWRGRQIIGPFKKFTCIIGPNGSGKSNVMDALSFVMGEKTANLRVRNIQELIHGAHIGKPISSFASVTIVYVEKSGEEKTFTRIIRGEGSEFRFDDKPVSRTVYLAELEKIGIVVKARNCLVFQGTVESISVKKPKEITQFFEEISTSGQFIGEYDEKKKKLQKAEEDAQFNFNKKKNVAAERKQAKLEKEEADRYQSLLDELKMNKIQLQLFQLYHNERKIRFLSIELEHSNRELGVTKESLSHQEDVVKAKKREHGMLTRQVQQTEKELKRPHSIQLSHLLRLLLIVTLSSAFFVVTVTALGSTAQTFFIMSLNRDGNLNQIQEQIEDHQKKIEKLEEYTKTCRDSLKEKKQQEEILGDEIGKAKSRMSEVNEEYNRIGSELQNAGIDNHEGRRQQKRAEVLEHLRGRYPESVFGRLVDLCHPIHKKYQLAVTKLFGRFMTAIVVASEKVAKDCIQFLKEERAEPETFLALDYLDIKPINERLREIKGCKMVIDVIKTQFPQLKKVIQFVCGNGLVCETLEEARRIAFGGPERRKTVALDGTLFLKSGLISGGSSDLKYKARFWDEKELKDLRDRRTQLVQELKDLMKTLRKETDLKQIQTLAQGTQTRLKYSQSELEMIKKKHLPAFCREKSQLQSELLNIESQCTMLSEGIKERQQRIEEFQKKIDKVEDDIFQHFCEEIGVENIREFENKHVKQQQEIDQKRLEFEKQKTQLKIQLEYNRSQLKKKQSKMDVLKETVQKGRKDVDNLKKTEEDCLKIMDELMDKQQQLKNVFATQNSGAEKAHAQIEEERKKLLAIDREVGKLQKEVVKIQTSVEHKRLEKHNMLLDCKVQDIEVVLLQGSLDDISEVELGTEPESTQATADIYEKEEAIELDYSSLSEDLKALQSDKDVEVQHALLLQQIASQEDVLLKTAAPNLRALEKLKSVRDKFQESTDAPGIDLCRFAFLSPENPEEPYLEGISYSCVAPGKRFMPMDNLSGGEKCVAALALLFAVHSFRPAPFFVLDEVDAALDNTNIGKVSSYIKEQTQEQFQMIVISLKEEFYSRADALVGICPEEDDCMFSRVLTLDLSQYPDTDSPEDSNRHPESRKDRAPC
ncbi:PREDICTED: structural maintenance of chromosomes protein 1B [Chrysochloris asiatica]|uniref:Structural maintenance of chromosomes protein 1B n=1 Tax=Chrysochloris asiatica TaxID=185453 RepID=A0A9B0WTS3_CHRAS|nr:PREDICTED: structural maintenance of chromosomes protein 1B [Chrysochloris asiatica]